MKRATLPLLVIVAATAACSDSNAPKDGEISGRYRLVQVNGAPLPFIVAAGFSGPTRVLTAGSVRVLSNGRLTDERTFHLGPVTANAADETDSTTYAYTQQGNLLLVKRPRINPAQTHVDSGVVSADQFTLSVHYVTPNDPAPTRATFLYRREQ